MINDSGKRLTIEYNHLNLPTRFTFRNTSNVITGVITIWYDASGKKLRKIVDDRTSTNDDYSKDYLDGIELTNGIVDQVAHPEGRIKQTNINLNLYQVEYQVQDHLGNTRVMFSDLNNNGTLFGATTAQAEIIQVNHYYPFGMNMEGPWNGSATDRNLNKYQYNGKELNQDFGLEWNDYGARWYDATIGRWHSVDDLMELTYSLTPYNYVLNSPMVHTDPTGMSAETVGIDGLTNQQWIKATRPGANPNLAKYYRQQNWADEINRGRLEYVASNEEYWEPYAGDEYNRELKGNAIHIYYSGAFSIPLPTFNQLLTNYYVYGDEYPGGGTSDSEFGEIVGGHVNININHVSGTGKWNNTCAVRVCHAFNMIGGEHRIGRGGDKRVSGKGKKNWYFFRVPDLERHLKRKYGAPEEITDLKSLLGRKGVIMYSIPYDDAYGHFTLWNGKKRMGGNHSHEEYVKNASKIYFWETN